MTVTDDSGENEDKAALAQLPVVRWALGYWWITLSLVLIPPVLVVLISRFTLNQVIPCNLLDFSAIRSATDNLPQTVSGALALGLYRYGLSIVAVFAGAFILASVSVSVLFKAANERSAGQGVDLVRRVLLPGVALLVLLGVALWWLRLDVLDNWRPKTCVARLLIDLTLNRYIDSGLSGASAPFIIIGNLASSVEDQLSWAMIALVAALLVAALAVVANASPNLNAEMRRKRRDHIVLATAVLLVATFFAGHTYLDLGGIPLKAHLGFVDEEESVEEFRLFTGASADYAAYQAAQELAWALTTSLTLAVIYVPTIVFSLGTDDDPASLADHAVKVLAIVSPWLTVQGVDLIASLTEGIG